MFTKTKMAVAAALVLGLASAAQAGSRDDAEYGHDVEPMGQSFKGATSAPRAQAFVQSGNAYGYAAAPHQSRSRKKASNH